MRFLVWCGCVTICLSGLELSLFARDGWKWVWIPLLIFYILAGLIGVGITLTKLAAGKLGAGLGRGGGKSMGPSLAPRKEEVEK